MPTTMSATKGPSRTPKSQLSASMEHIRYAVTADPLPHNSPPSNNPLPSSRSHDPSNNQKRTDPFQFGSRLLLPTDDPFSYNAWDHAVPDDQYNNFAETQYALQRAAPVSAFDKSRFNGNPARFWNAFYSNNSTNFFKDRKWLLQEYPVLAAITRADAPAATLLEVGAGAGNTAFPVLKLNQNPGLRIHAVDFSAKAVDLIRANEAYMEPAIRADVWDAASVALPPGLEEGSVDVVVMVFIFSALAPAQWAACVRNIWRVLKQGGCVLFRDYGRGDLAQVRFKKGRYLEENFYIRGDGTRVYFFEKEELERIWTGVMFKKDDPQGDLGSEEKDQSENRVENGLANLSVEELLNKSEIPGRPVLGFDIVNLGVDRRMLVNRQRKLKMYRCWMQGIFKKPGLASILDNVPKEALSLPPTGDERIKDTNGEGTPEASASVEGTDTSP